MSHAGPIPKDSSPAALAHRPGRRLPVGRVLLGLALVFGAYAKLHFNGAWHFQDYYFFLAMSMGSYRTLSLGAVELLAKVLPWMELALGGLLIGGIGTRWAAPVAGLLLVYMVQMPRAAILGLAGRTSLATELLVDVGFFLLAVIVTLRGFASHLARK